MTLKVTRWSPDTCSCTVEYQWDTEQSENERAHNLHNVVNRCPAHQSLPDAAIYNCLMDENPRKNISLAHCLEHGPAALYDIVNGSRQLKEDLDMDYSFSGTAPNRVLTINFKGKGKGIFNLTAQQKSGLQTALDNRFGPAKVLIV